MLPDNVYRCVKIPAFEVSTDTSAMAIAVAVRETTVRINMTAKKAASNFKALFC